MHGTLRGSREDTIYFTNKPDATCGQTTCRQIDRDSRASSGVSRRQELFSTAQASLLSPQACPKAFGEGMTVY